jgi:hypothetical protein
MANGANAGDAPHPGYVRIVARCGEGVVLTPLASAVREILDGQTLYAHAAAQLDRRIFVGRGPAYAASIADVPVVVRHTRHGGLLAPLTRDIFLAPTRAPHELAASLRLRAAGVRTPEVLGYATYRAGPLLRRSDVMTREIPEGQSLSASLRGGPTPAARADLHHAVDALVEQLSRAGAFHADLNMANVLIAPGASGAPEAFALDIDRVTFPGASQQRLARLNTLRLRASARRLGLEWHP